MRYSDVVTRNHIYDFQFMHPVTFLTYNPFSLSLALLHIRMHPSIIAATTSLFPSHSHFSFPHSPVPFLPFSYLLSQNIQSSYNLFHQLTLTFSQRSGDILSSFLPIYLSKLTFSFSLSRFHWIFESLTVCVLGKSALADKSTTLPNRGVDLASHTF